VLKAQSEPRARRVFKGLLDILDRRDFKALKALKVFKVHKVFKVPRVLKAHRAYKVCLATPDRLSWELSITRKTQLLK
jgi:hypothetical protein